MRRRSDRASARTSLILSATLLLVLVLSTYSLWAQQPSMPQPGGTAPSATLSVDPALSALPADRVVEAALTFDHHIAESELFVIAAAGLDVHAYRTLPIVAVRGTRAEIYSLIGLPGLRSVYLDRELPEIAAADDAATPRASGRGTTVAVIGSGADASSYVLRPDTAVVDAVALANGSFHSSPLVARVDARLIRIDAGEPLRVVKALAGFDWVLQNRREHRIGTIVESWGSRAETSPAAPLEVARRIARDAELVVVSARDVAPTTEGSER